MNERFYGLLQGESKTEMEMKYGMTQVHRWRRSFTERPPALAVDDARTAVRDADVVVTCVSFGPVRQVMTGDWFAPGALVVAVDYATSIAAGVAREAGLFLVDEEGQFRANRATGQFDDYPDPVAMLGAAIRDATRRPARGRVLVTHLGVGLADLPAQLVARLAYQKAADVEAQRPDALIIACDTVVECRGRIPDAIVTSEIYAFTHKALAATLDDSLGLMDYVGLAMETGRINYVTMELLNQGVGWAAGTSMRRNPFT